MSENSCWKNIFWKVNHPDYHVFTVSWKKWTGRPQWGWRRAENVPSLSLTQGFPVKTSTGEWPEYIKTTQGGGPEAKVTWFSSPFKIQGAKTYHSFLPSNSTMRDCEQVGIKYSLEEPYWGPRHLQWPSWPRDWDTLAHLQLSYSVAGMLHMRLLNSFHFNFRPFKVKDAISGYDKTHWLECLINTALSLKAHLIKSHSKTWGILGVCVKSIVYYWLILVSDSLPFSSSLGSVSSQCSNSQFF